VSSPATAPPSPSITSFRAGVAPGMKYRCTVSSRDIDVRAASWREEEGPAPPGPEEDEHERKSTTSWITQNERLAEVGARVAIAAPLLRESEVSIQSCCPRGDDGFAMSAPPPMRAPPPPGPACRSPAPDDPLVPLTAGDIILLACA